jgi:hypothetical protein
VKDSDDRSSDDDLRARLARVDPVRSAVSPEPFTSLRAQELLERAMTSTTDSPSTDAPAPSSDPSRSRRGLLAVAAAAAVAVAGVAGVALLGGEDKGGDDVVAAPVTLSLALGDAGAIQACMPFDVNLLKGMSPAFAATVESVEGDTVTLDVTKVYAGDDVDRVVLTQPGGASAVALDGVAFDEGKSYLVTAAQGTVNGCGYSGADTPELRASFEQAFGG